MSALANKEVARSLAHVARRGHDVVLVRCENELLMVCDCGGSALFFDHAGLVQSLDLLGLDCPHASMRGECGQVATTLLAGLAAAAAVMVVLLPLVGLIGRLCGEWS